MANIAANGIVLEPLTNKNYDSWSVLVKNYLMGHGLWEVVANPGSKADAQSKEAAETWEMKNAKALHIILLASGSINIISVINEGDSAADAWECFSELKSVDDPDSELDIEQGMYAHCPQSLIIITIKFVLKYKFLFNFLNKFIITFSNITLFFIRI
jgi:hypothetical protein